MSVFSKHSSFLFPSFHTSSFSSYISKLLTLIPFPLAESSRACPHMNLKTTQSVMVVWTLPNGAGSWTMSYSTLTRCRRRFLGTSSLLTLLTWSHGPQLASWTVTFSGQEAALLLPCNTHFPAPSSLPVRSVLDQKLTATSSCQTTTPLATVQIHFPKTHNFPFLSVVPHFAGVDYIVSGWFCSQARQVL